MDIYELVFFIGSLIICLISTIIIETICALPLLKWKKWEKSNFVDLLLINCLTNPVVVTISNIFIIKFLRVGSAIISGRLLFFYILMFIVETLVVPIEGWLLRKFNSKLGKKAYLIALYLNVISCLSGFVIFLF